MPVDMRQFLQSFFDEAAEHIETMEAALLQLESAPDDAELINTVFRSAHTIKGASSTFGVHAVGEFTHVLESLLERVRCGHVSVTPDLTEVLLSSVDIVSGLLRAAQDGTPEPDNTAAVVARLQELNAEPIAAGESAGQTEPERSEQTWEIVFRPSRDFFHFGLDPFLLLRDVGESGNVESITVDASELPEPGDLDPESCYLSWTLQLRSDRTEAELREAFMFVDTDTLVSVESLSLESEQTDLTDRPPVDPPEDQIRTESLNETPRAAGAYRESVRVDGERLDDMINQIGELVIGISMVEEEWASVSSGHRVFCGRPAEQSCSGPSGEEPLAENDPDCRVFSEDGSSCSRPRKKARQGDPIRHQW